MALCRCRTRTAVVCVEYFHFCPVDASEELGRDGHAGAHNHSRSGESWLVDPNAGSHPASDGGSQPRLLPALGRLVGNSSDGDSISNIGRFPAVYRGVVNICGGSPLACPCFLATAPLAFSEYLLEQRRRFAFVHPDCSVSGRGNLRRAGIDGAGALADVMALAVRPFRGFDATSQHPVNASHSGLLR